MPELTAIHFGLLALMLLIGAILGWIMRGDRCAKEKIAVSASWQNQLDSQQSEHGRLAEQNKSLMDQISQYQASQKDYSNRAKELSDSLKEAFARRDELQRQVKDVRGKLDTSIAQSKKLRDQNAASQSTAIRERDDKIFRLSRELTSWQNRVPPLVERFRERNEEATAAEEELEKVQSRLQALEDMVRSDQTRIEPVDANSLPDGGDASNEPIAMTSFNDAASLQDQIADESELDDVFVEEADDTNDLDPSLDDGAFAAVFENAQVDASGQNDDSVEEQSIEDKDNVAEIDVSPLPENDEPEVSASGTNGAADDLQLIKGIGPSIEKTLHEMGIVRFHQIAEMSEYDIDRVAQQLRGFRSRIYREDWIGQARDLQYQKNNNL